LAIEVIIFAVNFCLYYRWLLRENELSDTSMCQVQSLNHCECGKCAAILSLLSRVNTPFWFSPNTPAALWLVLKSPQNGFASL
jgi:hypothetical protein